MTSPIQFPGEERSNADRAAVGAYQPQALKTYTPSLAVLAKSAGIYHWTPEGKRLYDYTSGVLVANLGHNPLRWQQRMAGYLGWTAEQLSASAPAAGAVDDYFEAVPLTAYNAVTPIEAEAAQRLVANAANQPGGGRIDAVMWAASGSEAIQKALWACLHRDPARDLIIATRYGFHGKKGLAGAVTGSESDAERDPRVKFISFPMQEVDDVEQYGREIDLQKYREELEALHDEFGDRLNCLITEPYLGGGGSYHPPAAYHQLLQEFCRAHDILLIFDEVQANFGRTGRMYAFEAYGIEPDLVALGKGLGNGVPVAAVVGRRDVMDSLHYGEASDTWSANPLSCAAVLATLDEFESTDILEHTRAVSEIFFAELAKLKETPVITKVRGEGMVFGIECGPVGELSAEEVANAVVEAAYLGQGGDGIHLLGPLAGKVIRVSPPMTITADEAQASLRLLQSICRDVAERLQGVAAGSAT